MQQNKDLRSLSIKPQIYNMIPSCKIALHLRFFYVQKIKTTLQVDNLQLVPKKPNMGCSTKSMIGKHPIICRFNP